MPPDNWLTKLSKSAVRQPRTHLLWVNARDTPADVEAKRNRLIAAGRAHADDTFVHAGKGGTKPEMKSPAQLEPRPMAKQPLVGANHCFRLIRTIERATKACNSHRRIWLRNS